MPRPARLAVGATFDAEHTRDEQPSRARRRLGAPGGALLCALVCAIVCTATPVLAQDWDDDDDAWLDDVDDDDLEDEGFDDDDDEFFDDDDVEEGDADEDDEAFDNDDDLTDDDDRDDWFGDVPYDSDDESWRDRSPDPLDLDSDPEESPTVDDDGDEVLFDPMNPRAQPSPGAGESAPDESDGDEVLFDPTNPRVQTAPGDEGEDEELLVDPMNPRFQSSDEDGDEELLVDPTNPRMQSGDDDGDEEILVDPANTRSSGTSSGSGGRTSGSSLGRLGFFTGELTSSLASDLAYENPHEDVFVVTNQLDLGVRFDPSDTLDVLLEARFVHRLAVEHGDDDLDEGVWADPEGRFDAELREAYLRWSPGDLSLTIGNQFQLWGAMDIVSPAQLVHPTDLRAGPVTDGTDGLVPVFAADLRWFVSEALTLEAIVIPFFTPARGLTFGTDFSFGSAGGALATEFGAGPALDDALDNGIADALELALGRAGTPDESPENVGVGLRVSGRAGGVDMALGWLMDWDPIPVLTLDPDLARVVNAVLAAPSVLTDLDFGPLLADPLVVLALGRLQSNPRPLDELVNADYRRRHAFAADLETYFGPIGVRAEAVFAIARTVLVASSQSGLFDDGLTSFQTRRLPVFDAVLGVSWESSDTRWVLILEGFYRHTIGLEDGERPLPDDPHTGGVAFGVRAEPVDDWDVVLGTIWTASAPHDVVVTAETTVGVAAGVECFAQVAIFEGANLDDDVTVAGLVDNNDYAALGVRWTF